MAYSNILKSRILLGDPSGVLGLSDGELDALNDRGSRDMARRGLLVQRREKIDLTAGVRAYTLSSDHVDSYTMFQDRFEVVVRLLDQGANVWYLTVSDTGILSFTSTQPSGHTLFPSTNYYWLTILSPDATTWYVHPDLTGLLIATTVQPATGTGTVQTVQMRDDWGTPWYPAVNNMGIAAASTTGTANVEAPIVDDEAMQRVEPEAITRIDARAITGEPRRFAIAGKVLYVHPTPDLGYQLNHLYFSDSTDSVPDAAQYLPVMFGVAMGLQRSLRPAAAQTVLSMYRAEIDILALNLFPGSRDGLSVYQMPER